MQNQHHHQQQHPRQQVNQHPRQQVNQHHRQQPTHNNNHGQSSHPQAAQPQGPATVNVFSCRGPSATLPAVDLGIDLTSVQAEIDKCKRRYHKELWNVLCGTVLPSDKNGWKKSDRDDESSKASRSVGGQGAGVASRRGDTGDGSSDDGAHNGEEEEDEEGEEGGETTDEANENNRQAASSKAAASVRQRPLQRRRGVRPAASWQDNWRNNGNSGGSGGGLSGFLNRIRPEEGVQDWRSADANTSSRSSRASIVGFSDRLDLAGGREQQLSQQQQRRRSRQRLFFESATAPAVNNNGGDRSRRPRSISSRRAPDEDSDDSDDCDDELGGGGRGVDSDFSDGGDSDADTWASRPTRFVPMFCGTWGGSGRRPAGRSNLRQRQQPPQQHHQRSSSRGRLR